jgi:hypothetical protein
MPWQAQLFIGVPVKTHADIRAIYVQLGSGDVISGLTDEELEFDFGGIQKFVMWNDKLHHVNVEVMIEREGGTDFPVVDDTADTTSAYTDAIVGFGITSRYRPAILDRMHPKGRPEPFCFDPLELNEILVQVRQWWPEAQTMIWDVFY